MIIYACDDQQTHLQRIWMCIWVFNKTWELKWKDTEAAWRGSMERQHGEAAWRGSLGLVFPYTCAVLFQLLMEAWIITMPSLKVECGASERKSAHPFLHCGTGVHPSCTESTCHTLILRIAPRCDGLKRMDIRKECSSIQIWAKRCTLKLLGKILYSKW